MNAPDPNSVPEIGAVLADIARIGPWFAVRPLPEGLGDTWRRWDELYAAPGVGDDPLSARIDQVADALRCDRRTAASIAVQGLAARLVSMPFAAVALHGVLPLLGQLYREPGGDDPWAPGLPADTPGRAAGTAPTAGPGAAGPGIAGPGAAGTDAAGPDDVVGPAAVPTPDPVRDPAGAADLLARELARTHLEPLYAAVGARIPVSPRILRGNAVSAIAGAARLLEDTRRADRPAYLALLGATIGHPALRGPLPEGATGQLQRGDPGWSFRRRSCCLYVRVPGGGTCGDCVLVGQEGRDRRAGRGGR